MYDSVFPGQLLLPTPSKSNVLHVALSNPTVVPSVRHCLFAFTYPFEKQCAAYSAVQPHSGANFNAIALWKRDTPCKLVSLYELLLWTTFSCHSFKNKSNQKPKTMTGAGRTAAANCGRRIRPGVRSGRQPADLPARCSRAGDPLIPRRFRRHL